MIIGMTKDLENVIVNAVVSKVYRRILSTLGKLLSGEAARDEEEHAKRNGKARKVRKPRDLSGSKKPQIEETPEGPTF